MRTLDEFDGRTYVRQEDAVRLTGNLARVYEALSDGEWHDLDELRRVGGSAADSRVRDLRKPKFGGHTVECRRVEGGRFVYRLVGA